MAEEKRDRARIRIAAYQSVVAKGYNRLVHLRSFKLDDLVLREEVGKGKREKKKLDPNSEGQYKTTKIVGVGSYKLEAMDGTPVP